jgi:hypothetical protein
MMIGSMERDESIDKSVPSMETPEVQRSRRTPGLEAAPDWANVNFNLRGMGRDGT